MTCALSIAANSLQLPRNPLHFPSPQSQSSRSIAVDEYDDGDVPSHMVTPPQMTLTVMTPFSTQGRALMAPSPRRNPTPSKAKIFFDELVNVPNKQSDVGDVCSPTAPAKPRIIYIRDFPTLAPTSSTWYPPLLSAVRQRRQGPLSRPTSPINNPMAIIFGMTPPLTAPATPPPNHNSGFMNHNTQSPSSISGSKSSRSEWSEDDVGDNAREKRLRDRLRIWEKGDKALLDELPKLSSGTETDAGNQRPEILVIGGPGAVSTLPPVLAPGMVGNSGPRHALPVSSETGFFRTSILVPNIRSLTMERACRVGRRREINELTMRMGVGAVGGILGMRSDAIEESDAVQEDTDNLGRKDEKAMWDDWGRQIEEWSAVRQIADHAVGSVISANALASLPEKTTLDPTYIPWSAVCGAWSAQKQSAERRKAWTKQTAETSPTQEEDEKSAAQNQIDEVVERIKQDPDDQYEYRLLPCIVDPGKLSCMSLIMT